MDEATCRLMGVLNITPDSFSDGGCFLNPAKAMEQAEHLLVSGADIIDVGAESSRPGSRAIDSKEEWERLRPVLGELNAQGMIERVSIDTRNDETMQRALDYDIAGINNISGLAGPDILRQIGERGSMFYCAMHMYKNPQTMQEKPLGADDANARIEAFFRTARSELKEAGLSDAQVFLDPGIGFGKSDPANWQILSRLQDWSKIGQVLIGISRKSFLGRWIGIEDPTKRDDLSKGLEAGLMLSNYVKIVRTHNVAPLAKLRDHLGRGAQ